MWRRCGAAILPGTPMRWTFPWRLRRRVGRRVRGTLHVTSATMPATDDATAVVHLHGVVTADGIAPTLVQHAGVVDIAKWPMPGARLPVTVDADDLGTLRIEWDEVA